MTSSSSRSSSSATLRLGQLGERHGCGVGVAQDGHTLLRGQGGSQLVLGEKIEIYRQSVEIFGRSEDL